MTTSPANHLLDLAEATEYQCGLALNTLALLRGQAADAEEQVAELRHRAEAYRAAAALLGQPPAPEGSQSGRTPEAARRQRTSAR